MNLDKVFNWLGGITAIAIVAVIVASPNTGSIIRSFGTAWSGAINAATAPVRRR